MITSEQIADLAKFYNIDGFTLTREYLQLLFLAYLYQNKKADKIYFKGGTAIRFLLGSPRFSEDLDFSTPFSKIQIKQIVKEAGQQMEKELPGLQTLPLYAGRTGIRFRVRYALPHFKYPLTIRLDFTETKKAVGVVVSPLVSKFPISVFPLVSRLAETEILAEKIQALTSRHKGRDLFDVWFLLEKGVNPPKVNFDKKNLIKKIKAFPQAELDRDLVRFLPKPQRKITGMLKEKLIERLGQKIGY